MCQLFQPHSLTGAPTSELVHKGVDLTPTQRQEINKLEDQIEGVFSAKPG